MCAVLNQSMKVFIPSVSTDNLLEKEKELLLNITKYLPIILRDFEAAIKLVIIHIFVKVLSGFDRFVETFLVMATSLHCSRPATL